MKKTKYLLIALCAAICVFCFGLSAVGANVKSVAAEDELVTYVYCTVSDGTTTYTFGTEATDETTNYYHAADFQAAVEAAYKKITASGYTLKIGAGIYAGYGAETVYLHDSFFNPDATTNGTEYPFTLDLNGNTFMEMSKKDDNNGDSISDADTVTITVTDSAPVDSDIAVSSKAITADGLYFVYIKHGALSYDVYNYYSVTNIGTSLTSDSVTKVSYYTADNIAHTEYFNALNDASFVNGETAAEKAEYILDSKVAALRVAGQTAKKYGTATHPATIDLLCDINGFPGEEELSVNQGYVVLNLGSYWIRAARALTYSPSGSNELIHVSLGGHLTVTATTGGLISSELDCFQVNNGSTADIDSYLYIYGGTYSSRGKNTDNTDSKDSRAISLNGKAHIVMGNNTVDGTTYTLYMKYRSELVSGNSWYTVSTTPFSQVVGMYRTGSNAAGAVSTEITVNGGEFSATGFFVIVGSQSNKTAAITINGGNFELGSNAALCTVDSSGVPMASMVLKGGTYNVSVDNYCDQDFGGRGYHSVYNETTLGDSSTGSYSVTLVYEAHIKKTKIADSTSSSAYYSTFALAMSKLTNTDGYTTAIYLDHNLTFTSACQVNAGLDFTVNFNGYYISSSLVDGPFDLASGSVMFAGSTGGITYTGSESVYYAVRAGGADVKILGGFYNGKIDEMINTDTGNPLSAVVLQGGYFSKLNAQGSALNDSTSLGSYITADSGYAVDSTSHNDYYIIIYSGGTEYAQILTVNLENGATATVIYTVFGVTARQYVSVDATEINMGSYASGTAMILTVIPSSGSFTTWNMDGKGGDVRNITVAASNNLFVDVRKVITITQNAGASVRLSDPIGLRFTSSIAKSAVNAVFSLKFGTYGVAKVAFGMLLMPADYLADYAYGTAHEVSFLKYYLENYGVASPKYVICEKANMTASGDAQGNYDIRVALVNIKAKNYDRKFMSVTYMIVVDKGGNRHMVFGIGAESSYTSASGADYGSMTAKYSRDVYGVATAAYNDRKSSSSGSYINFVDDNNTYSPYTDVQRNALSIYLDSSIKLDASYAPLASGAYSSRLGYSVSNVGSEYTISVTNVNVMGSLTAKICKIYVAGVDVTANWAIAADGKSATFTVA